MPPKKGKRDSSTHEVGNDQEKEMDSQAPDHSEQGVDSSNGLLPGSIPTEQSQQAIEVDDQLPAEKKADAPIDLDEPPENCTPEEIEEARNCLQKLQTQKNIPGDFQNVLSPSSVGEFRPKIDGG